MQRKLQSLAPLHWQDEPAQSISQLAPCWHEAAQGPTSQVVVHVAPTQRQVPPRHSLVQVEPDRHSVRHASTPHCWSHSHPAGQMQGPVHSSLQHAPAPQVVQPSRHTSSPPEVVDGGETEVAPPPLAVSSEGTPDPGAGGGAIEGGAGDLAAPPHRPSTQRSRNPQSVSRRHASPGWHAPKASPAHCTASAKTKTRAGAGRDMSFGVCTARTSRFRKTLGVPPAGRIKMPDKRFGSGAARKRNEATIVTPKNNVHHRRKADPRRCPVRASELKAPFGARNEPATVDRFRQPLDDPRRRAAASRIAAAAFISRSSSSVWWS